ncbi:MAG: NAD(P)-binding protein [Gammaproteobacteria bacterium]|nr:NAD(P)-binding protein [Gammaproteobacteria bacterium]
MNIAIIGAGMSAAAAVTVLKQQGCQVSVFEKSRGPGGRMSSKRALAGSLDLGAQYFTARHDDFVAQVESWRKQGLVQIWPMQPWVFENSVLSRSDDQQVRYVGTSTMHQMLVPLFEGVDCHYQCKINELSFITSNVSSHSHGQWQLCSEQGECYGGFDALLLTSPPQQSRQLLTGAPILSQIPADALLPCWAVLLELATPTGVKMDAIFVKDGSAGWIARQSTKPGRQSARLRDVADAPEQWVLHFTADFSARELEASAERISELAAAELSRVLGRTVDVAAALCHRWLYASYNPALAPCGVLFDRKMQLALAGDWALGGRVENAWLAGKMAAEKLLELRDQSGGAR